MTERYTLNQEAFWFQEITVSEEEQVALEIMLEETGWVKAETFGDDELVEKAINTGWVWWTIINGTKWVVLKPMSKKGRKIFGKALRKDMKRKGIKPVRFDKGV